jgi:hypothetical protein
VSQSAAEVFELIKRSHRAESPGGGAMHEAFSLLESQLRFVGLLAAATARSGGNRSIRVGRSPGLGEWISFLRSIGSELHEVGTDPARIAKAVLLHSHGPSGL